MALISLVYVSFETRPMAEDDLMKILESARRNNEPRHVTGMLLYRDGYFIQALEGEEEDVDYIYQRILKDDRHKSILLVAKENVETRAFGVWSMGFKNLQTSDLSSYKQYTTLLDAPFDQNFFSDSPSRAKTLLKLFVEQSNF